MNFFPFRYLDMLEHTISSALNVAVLTSEPLWFESYMPDRQRLICTAAAISISLLFYCCNWKWSTCFLVMFTTICYIWEYIRLLNEAEVNVNHGRMVYMEKCEQIKRQSYYDQFLFLFNAGSDSECKRYYMETFSSSIFNVNPMDPIFTLIKRVFVIFIKGMGHIFGNEFADFFGKMSYFSMFIILVCFISGVCLIVYKVSVAFIYYSVFRPAFSNDEYEAYRKVEFQKKFEAEMAKKKRMISKQVQVKKLKRCHSLGSLDRITLM